MSAYRRLKSACCNTSFKTFDDLTPGKYTVNGFKLFKTRYGQRLAVQIGQTYLNLPNRFAEEITSQEHVNELNKARYTMNYLGKDKAQQNRIMLEFLMIAAEDRMDDDDVYDTVE